MFSVIAYIYFLRFFGFRSCNIGVSTHRERYVLEVNNLAISMKVGDLCGEFIGQNIASPVSAAMKGALNEDILYCHSDTPEKR